MSQIYNIVRAVYVRDYVIDLTFNDGLSAEIDFSQFLFGSVFEPLKQASYFKKFFLDGWTIAWPNGADVAPETLYEMAQKQSKKTSKYEQSLP